MLAALLRRAGAGNILEEEFWREWDRLADRMDDPAISVAFESAMHYWGNFHSRNILMVPVKPNPGQLEQGKNEMNLIADYLDEGRPFSLLEQRLRDI